MVISDSDIIFYEKPSSVYSQTEHESKVYFEPVGNGKWMDIWVDSRERRN